MQSYSLLSHYQQDQSTIIKTQKLERFITEFLKTLPGMPALDALQKARAQLVAELQKAEQERMPLREPAHLQRAHLVAEAELNERRSEYAAQRKVHAEEVQAITADAQAANQELQKVYTHTELGTVRGLVRRVDLHYGVMEKSDELHNAESGCCGCLGLFKRKKMQEELAKRVTEAAEENQRTAAAETLADEQITRLEQQEATLWEKKRLLMQHEPILDDDKQQRRNATLSATLKHNESVHYHSLPIAAMAECVRFYQHVYQANQAITTLITQSSATIATSTDTTHPNTLVAPPPMTDMARLRQAIENRASRLDSTIRVGLGIASRTHTITEKTPLLTPSPLAQLTELSSKLAAFTQTLAKKLRRFYSSETWHQQKHSVCNVMDCIDYFNKALNAEQQDTFLKATMIKDIPQPILDVVVPPAPPQVCIAFARR
ncbi:MAG TPA: hypothetical protein VJN02_11715 [Gammaproteobacteria bacterium]|nr:MAG: hypothetical protein A3E83_07015 [Gammaproteobacteria bacterium RIFCSPHIGHO2_12_FULL_41_20]HLB43489.1 hypothetical protein [Gammaproteobacteria bacterium]